MTEALTPYTSYKKTYGEGLEDPRWRKLRLRILQRDGHVCRICGSKERLHIHHRQYHRDKLTGEWKRPWEYDQVFLVTLCEGCHYRGHQQFSIPIKDI